MLRSMYAGISGMRGFQTKLDVIGNNIANVSTPGFKKGRVTFQDMMSQTSAGAQGPTATRGGANPIQVGLGSQLGTIDNIHTQGFRQTTDSPLDFQIEGDGMFVVADRLEEAAGVVDIDESNIFYTRAGNFGLDEDGYIVNPQGYYLMGFQAVETDPAVAPPEYNVNNGSEGTNKAYSRIRIPGADEAESFSVQANGVVTYVDTNGELRVAGQVALASFSNPAGLDKAGSNLFRNSANAGLADDLVAPESDESATSIISNALEMSNVDLAEEFTEMITAQRAFQANTRIITTSDEILQELVNLKR